MKMRIVQAASIIITGVAWGIWCGGDLTKFLGISIIGLIGALGILAVSTLIFSTKTGRISLLAGTIVAIIAGVMIGSGYASSAFNDCVMRGEIVRDALARYKVQNGHYPDDLSELETNLPGSRLLRGNILDYKRTDDGYDIQFQDWLITHLADENTEFEAQK